MYSVGLGYPQDAQRPPLLYSYQAALARDVPKPLEEVLSLYRTCVSFRVRQHFVCSLDYFEVFLAGAVIGVRIRVVLADQLSVRFANVFLGSFFGDPNSS